MRRTASQPCLPAAAPPASQLAPLHGLPQLRCLQLELGVVELAGVPPQVRELRLVEVDRLALPTAQRQWEQAQRQGASIADRLLAAAASAGEARDPPRRLPWLWAVLHKVRGPRVQLNKCSPRARVFKIPCPARCRPGAATPGGGLGLRGV